MFKRIALIGCDIFAIRRNHPRHVGQLKVSFILKSESIAQAPRITSKHTYYLKGRDF
jgi:hypothetical protein